MIQLLIDSDQNPHGRMLIQDGDTLYVLTGCCGEKFDNDCVVDGVSWTQCLGCGTVLDKNDGGWSSNITNIGNFAEYKPSALSAWGKFWFGLDEFDMKVEK